MPRRVPRHHGVAYSSPGEPATCGLVTACCFRAASVFSGQLTLEPAGRRWRGGAAARGRVVWRRLATIISAVPPSTCMTRPES